MQVLNFKVKWHYAFIKKTSSLKRTPVLVRKTTCQIIDFPSGVVIAQETTTLNVKDQDNKETARKCSLSKALSKLNKEDRAVFWETYRNLKKTPKW